MSVTHKYFPLQELFPLHYRGLQVTPGQLIFGSLTKAQHPANDKRPIEYRPYDTRYLIAYDPAADFNHLAKQALWNSGYFLNVVKDSKERQPATAFITRHPVSCSFLSESCHTYMFPLYLKHDTNDSLLQAQVKMNLSEVILNRFSRHLGLSFLAYNDLSSNVCMASNPEVMPEFRITYNANDLLQYIYAVLITNKFPPMQGNGFPLIPFPTTSDNFWQMASLGSNLMKFHLMEISNPNDDIPDFPVHGHNIIELPASLEYSDEKSSVGGIVRINESQYFSNVPPEAWIQKTGDYQPAGQWLTDRLNQKLSTDDIEHYKRIIASLSATSKLL